MTVPSNGPKSQMDIETVALEEAVRANKRLGEIQAAGKIASEARADSSETSGEVFGKPADTSCDSCTTMLAIVSAIVAALIFVLLFWLFFGKASNEQVVAVQKTATEASATAKTAAKNAEEAKAGMAEVTSLKSQLTALKKEMATVAANADTANAKADAANSKADNAVSAMKKAQVAPATGAKNTHTNKYSPEPSKVTPVTPHASQGQSGTQAYWYWRENTATVEKPGKCIFSGGDGNGKPPFCATFTISGVNKGETKADWIGRVGAGRVVIDQAVWQKKD